VIINITFTEQNAILFFPYTSIPYHSYIYSFEVFIVVSNGETGNNTNFCKLHIFFVILALISTKPVFSGTQTAEVTNIDTLEIHPVSDLS